MTGNSNSPAGGPVPLPASALEPHELEALSAHAAAQAFPKGAVIINEGDRSDSIFIIASGRVKVFLHGRDGREVVLNVHGPGEYFGEMVLDEGPRSASVMTPCCWSLRSSGTESSWSASA